MKKLISIFVIIACATSSLSYGAVSVKKAGVKKAAPVATKQTDKMDVVNGLLPTVVGLVGTVTELKKQTQELGAGCEPTSSEIDVVNSLMKEYAKTGATTVKDITSNLGKKCCAHENNSSGCYQSFMENRYDNEDCYESFSSSADKGTVWYDYPKASYAKICDVVNTKDCKVVSNVYDIFGRINFDESDYTTAEADRIAKFREKMEKCSDGKRKAAKAELVGGFVKQTLGSVGQTTGAAGTTSVLEAVSAMGGSGKLNSLLPSLGTVTNQLLDK